MHRGMFSASLDSVWPKCCLGDSIIWSTELVLSLQILQNLAKCDCSMCKLVLTVPVCTPCGHQFCKACLEAKYAAEAPTDCVARPLRTRKQRKPCPVCNKELADFVEGPTFQVSAAVLACALFATLSHLEFKWCSSSNGAVVKAHSACAVSTCLPCHLQQAVRFCVLVTLCDFNAWS